MLMQRKFNRAPDKGGGGGGGIEDNSKIAFLLSQLQHVVAPH